MPKHFCVCHLACVEMCIRDRCVCVCVFKQHKLIYKQITEKLKGVHFSVGSIEAECKNETLSASFQSDIRSDILPVLSRGGDRHTVRLQDQVQWLSSQSRHRSTHSLRHTRICMHTHKQYSHTHAYIDINTHMNTYG